jgi:hypothetical protein
LLIPVAQILSSERIGPIRNSVRQEDAMTFYSATTEIGRAVLNTLARHDRDDAHVPADHVDLTAVFLFVAAGLLLTAAFFTLGFGAQIGEILAASG